MLAGLRELRATDKTEDKAALDLVQAFAAAARHQPQAALRYARATLAHAQALGISHDYPRWAWPLAARAASELRDTAATGELLALLDACQPGQLAPMQRAERDLARARLAGDRRRPGRHLSLRRRDRRPARAEHPLPPRPRPARPGRPSHPPGRCQRRRGRHRRSPRHRPAPGLPAAAGPGRRYHACQIPGTGLDRGAPPIRRTIPTCLVIPATAPQLQPAPTRPE